MSESFFSPYWYRVQDVRPALRAHLAIHRHHYRGERWYVMQDKATGRHHRFGPAAYYSISLMDGRRTLENIFEAAATHLGDDAPTQNQLIQLIGQLHASDALSSDVTPDASEVFRRFSAHRKKTLLARFTNPLSLRFPLYDPDALLTRWLPRVRPFFTRAALAAWCALVLAACLGAAQHWDALTARSLASVLDPKNLLLMLATYPLVKLLHELGHAFATKQWGGEVHETGVMFLLFVPVPYVDASASWAFGNKWRRILVSASGVMVELALSALALFLWLAVDPGWLRDACWNVMVIGGLSTLFFNGNPLMRFDGYYAFADWVEIPNLGARANQLLGSLFQQHALGLPERRTLVVERSERIWLACYGAAAFVYRQLVMIAIAFMVAQRFFGLGVAFAIWTVGSQTVLPLVRSLLRLRADPRVSQRSARVARGFGVLAVVSALLLFVIPVPVWTAAEGVVWLPEKSQLRAGADGFVARILVRPGAAVAAGTPLVLLDDPLHRARLRATTAREREVRARSHAALVLNLVEHQLQREELRAVQAELAREKQRAAEHIVRAPSAGTFVLPVAENLPGRFVKRGDVLGYIANAAEPTVRAVVSQEAIGRVREGVRTATVRLVGSPGVAIQARVLREVPSPDNKLPSMALGAAGGGAVAVDTRDADGLTAIDTWFQLELALASPAAMRTLGGRTYVRLDHAPRALAPLLYDATRRLFLGRLGV